MSCSACGEPNREGARFCRACGGALGVRCPRCETCLPEAATFCDACGARVGAEPSGYTPRHLTDGPLSSRSAIEGERKNVTVMFVDVLGSMDLAGSVDAEDWHAIMDRFFAIVGDGIHRFEGTINQFTGDGIMALFGAPVAHEDHAQRACWAALHVREELDRFADELKRRHGLAFSVRMGINSGEAVVGTIGDQLRSDYTAQGAMVGLAARLEQLADPGATYLSDATAALVSGFFELRDLGVFDLKGVPGSVRVHELLGQGRMRTRLDVSRARGFSPFVGRADEMSSLEAALERTVSGNGQVVGVVAEAGVGKSRLCFEFAEHCRARGVRIRSAAAVPHDEMIPFRLVFELLRGFFGVREQDSEGVARQKIAGAVLLADPALTEGLPFLFDFLGVPDPRHPARHLDPEARGQRLLAIVTRLVQMWSQREPIALLIEDLHWIDSGSESFLEHLVETLPGTRILVLVNFRPDHRAAWMERSWYQQIPLHPLGDDTTAELLDHLLGADPSVRDLADRVRARSGGNPFFVEEVVRSLVESGSLVGGPEAYRLVTPIEEIAVPATVRAVLAARIDRLDDREKQLLQTASVVGKSFSAPLLQRVSGLAGAGFEAAMRALVQAEFLYQEALYPVEEYAFKHPLTQEVAYDSQLADARARVHASAGAAIEELYADRLDEHAARLAQHAEAAGDPLTAARWHRRAAEWVGISDPAAANRHWRAVIEGIGDVADSPEQRELALVARIWMLQLAWRLGFSQEETSRVFESGVELAEGADDPVSIVRLTLGYAVYCGVAGDEEEQYQYGRDAARLADRLEEFGLSLAARGAMATALQFLGRLSDGIAVATRGIDEAPEDPTGGAEQFWISPYVYVLGLRGMLCSLSGRLVDGRVDLERALELASASGDREITACVSGFLVQHACDVGDPVAALAHGQRAVELADATGIPLLRADAYQALASAHLLAEQWGPARAAGERALAIFRERRIMQGPRPRVLLRLAEASLGEGEVARSRELVDEVLASSRRRRIQLVELAAQLLHARIALRSDGAAAADAIQDALSSALALIDKTGARSLRPAVHGVLAEVAEVAGDAENRRRQLGEALRGYAELGATGHAERLARAV